MKKKHLKILLTHCSSSSLIQALQDFLQENDILVLSEEDRVTYKTWDLFVKRQAEIPSEEFNLWKTQDHVRQFFRLWRLQDTALPLLLSRYSYQKKGYLKVRRQELKEAGLKFFSKIIGIKTASSYYSYGWKWENTVSIPYIRQSYRGSPPFKPEIDFLLGDILKEDYTSSSGFLLAGTPLIKTKVESLWSPRVKVEEPIRLSRGLYAVKITCDKTFSDSSQIDIDGVNFERSASIQALELMGSTYSTYQLHAEIYSQKISPPLTLIQEDLREQNFPRFFLAGQNLIASYLLESLKKCQELLAYENIKFNPSFMLSISYLKQYIAWMKLHKKDYERFSQMFEMAFEEISLFLMMAKSYLEKDYKEILNKILLVPPGFNKQHFFMSSGMDALTLALIAALKDHPDSGVYIYNGNYFELELCLKHGAKKSDHPESIVIFNLNPTCFIDHKISLGEVEKWLSKQEQPITLIVDHTLEAPVSLEQLYRVLNPWIETGILNLILCKSHQKYTGFGLAKVMSGNLTVINQSESFKNSIKFLNAVEQENDNYKKPEYQIMAHQLDLNAEFDFEKKATSLVLEKVKFIAAICPDVFINAESEFFLYLPFLKENKSDLEYLFDINGLECRESFGFLRCSYVEISNAPPYYRINIGFEPNERLVEKLYNFYILKNYGLNTKTLYLLLNSELELKTNENYQHNKLAALFVIFLVSVIKGQFDFKPDFTVEEKFIDKIYDFIKKSPYVSQEQKRKTLYPIFVYKMNKATCPEEALKAFEQMYYSLSNQEIIKALRNICTTKEHLYESVIKKLVKISNLAHILCVEINLYMKKGRFIFAKKILEILFDAYKENCPTGFYMKETIKALLRSMLKYEQTEDSIQFSSVIFEHYPELFDNPHFSVLKESMAKIKLSEAEEKEILLSVMRGSAE